MRQVIDIFCVLRYNIRIEIKGRRNPEMSQKTALVTGGTSGIGKATAEALVKAGYTVYSLSRHASDDADGIRHLTADVTLPDTVRAAVSEVLGREGRIDLLVNCAGFGISGAVEFTDPEEAKRQFDTNFFGTVNVTGAVIPLMRAAGGGRIVNVSSVAAEVPIPFQTFYSASKAAINSYTMALANELRPFSVSVCAVEPGDIRTGFTAARHKQVLGDDIYGGRIGRSVARMEKDEQGGMDPSVIGRFIARIARKSRVKPLYTVGFGYKLAVLVMRLLPSRWSNRIIGRLYAK